jgi:hypothetical protein
MIYSDVEYRRRARLKRKARRCRIKAVTKRLQDIKNLLMNTKVIKKRKKKPRKDYYNSQFWQWLQDPALNDPNTAEGKLFRRLYRVPYPVYLDLLEKCKTFELFGTNEHHICSKVFCAK